MKTYEFTITLSGDGDTPETAWMAATEALALDRSTPPVDGVDGENVQIVAMECNECGTRIEADAPNFPKDSDICNDCRSNPSATNARRTQEAQP